MAFLSVTPKMPQKKCLTVAKDKELCILRATVLCGSDVASDSDEDCHTIMRKGIYLVHDSKLNTLKLNSFVYF